MDSSGLAALSPAICFITGGGVAAGIVNMPNAAEGESGVSKTWFRDRDGKYFRNCGCVERDKRRALLRPWLWWRLPSLDREWWEIFREGVTRADKIGRFDRVAEPIPFRVAYPNHPGLWRLDDTE